MLHLAEYKAPIENVDDDEDESVTAIDMNNVRALARHISKSLENSLATLNLRETSSQQLKV